MIYMVLIKIYFGFNFSTCAKRAILNCYNFFKNYYLS